MTNSTEYVSGQGEASKLPPELDQWNWGAFLLNWVWGIANRTPWALLVFIPFFGFVWLFVLGSKGNKWAWQNQEWRDIEHFRSTQRQFGYIGIAIIGGWFAFFIAMMAMTFIVATGIMKDEVYEKSLKSINQSALVTATMGKPITSGWLVNGHVKTTGATGQAIISYSVFGPKGQGNAYVKATRKFGDWTLDEVVVATKGRKIKVK